MLKLNPDMRTPRFGNKRPGSWYPKNMKEEDIRRKNIEEHNNKKNDIEKSMYKMLGCNCNGKDISNALSGIIIKSPEEFLRMSSLNENIFPAGFRKQPTFLTAKYIYEKTKDKLNLEAFSRELNKHSRKDFGEDITECERYYYICKIAGRLERCGVFRISLKDLQRFYELVPENNKEDAFEGFFRGAKSIYEMWGKEHTRKIGIGKIIVSYKDIISYGEVSRISIRNWIEFKVDNLEEKINVFDVVANLGKPWVDAIYLGTNLLVEYIKGLPK